MCNGWQSKANDGSKSGWRQSSVVVVCSSSCSWSGSCSAMKCSVVVMVLIVVVVVDVAVVGCSFCNCNGCNCL